MYHLMPALYDDIAELASQLRQMDLLELKYQCPELTPFEAIQRSMNLSTMCESIFLNNKLVGICGLGIVNDGITEKGIVWLIGSDDLTAEPLGFIKTSRRVVANMLDYCAVLENEIINKNTTALNWLRSMMFKGVASLSLGGEDFTVMRLYKEDFQNVRY